MNKIIIIIFSLLLLFTALYTNIIDADIEVFKNMINNNMFDDVIFIISDLIDENPDYYRIDELIYLLGEAYYGIGNYEKSYNKYLKIYTDHKNSNQYDNALYKIGEVSYRLDKNKDAINYLTDFITNYQNNPLIERGKYFIGESYIKLDNYENALNYLEPLANNYENPLFYHANYSLGWVYFNLKDYKKSISYYKNVENRDGFGISNLHIGEAYLHLEDYQNAKNYFSKISANDNYYKNALYFLTIIANRTDNEKDFGIIISTLNSLFPDNNLTIEANYNYANYLYNKNKFEEALNYFNIVLKYENTLSQYNNLSNILHLTFYFTAYTNHQLFNKTKKTNYFNEAVNLYKSYLNKFKNHSYEQRALFRLGEIYADNNDITNSIHYYELVIDEDLYDKALFDIARLHIKNNNNASAIKYLLKIKTDLPQSELINESNYLIARYYFDEKDYTKAIHFYKEIISTEKENLKFVEDSYYNLGWAFSHLNSYNDAINSFENLLSNFPETGYKTNVLFQISRLYFEINDYFNAEKILADLKTTDKTEENRRLYNLGIIKSIQGDNQANNNNFTDALQSYTAATQYFNKSENINDYINIQIKIADLQFQQNNFEESKKIYYELLNNYKKNENYLYFLHGLGWNYFKLKNYIKSIEYFKLFNSEYLSGNYNNITNDLFQESLLLIGESYNFMNDFNNTHHYYNEYIKHFPEGLYANDIKINLSKLVAVHKSPEEALQLLLNQYYNVPNPKQRKDITYNICIIFFDLENYEEYLNWSNIFFTNYQDEIYEKVLKFNEIISLYNLEQNDKSIQLASKFIETYPEFDKNDQLYFLKGAMYYNDKKYQNAIDNLNIVIKSFSNGTYIIESLYLTGLSYYYLNDFKKSIIFFNKLLDEYPETAFKQDALYFKLVSLAGMNEHKNVLEIADEIIKNENDTLRKIKEIFYKGKALFETGETENSISVLNEAIQIYSSNESDNRISGDDIISQILYELGNIYQKSNNLRHALLQYGRIISAYPFENYVDKAEFERAKTFIKLNRIEAAKNILENFKNNFPDSILLKEANNLLNTIK